jgi:TonB family protein
VIVGQKLLAPHDVSPAAQPVAQPATQTEPSQSEHSTPAAVAPSAVPRPAAPVTQPANHQKTGSATEGGVLHQVIPDVPRSASNTITGRIKVKVRVEVDTSGKVTNATLTTPGPSKYFANLALKAAQQWEFTAPQLNGQPTPSTWTLLFEFSKTSTKAFPSREHR